MTKGFRYERFFTLKDFANHVLGGALMGTGGVLAMGCTIGQGVTGISTLAIGSILVFLVDRDRRCGDDAISVLADDAGGVEERPLTTDDGRYHPLAGARFG